MNQQQTDRTPREKEWTERMITISCCKCGKRRTQPRNTWKVIQTEHPNRYNAMCSLCCSTKELNYPALKAQGL
jgi:hypothetical protein